MGSEVLIYAYGLVCLSMLAFNLLYALYLRAGERRTARRVKSVGALAGPAVAALEADGALPRAHLPRLEARLLRVNALLAFDDYLKTLPEDRAGRYLGSIASIFPRLAQEYYKREETQGAYFCRFVAEHGACFGDERLALARRITPFVGRRGVYSRVNALKALCALGDADTLLDSLLYLGRDDVESLNVDGRVIVETLMGYGGDVGAFISKIWERLDRFPVGAQRVLLDYIRFRSGGYRDEMLGILLDDGRDRELRFAAIRYFGRYTDERARRRLLDFVSDTDPGRWEFAAISASSLAGYPGEDTVRALSGAMHSPNWYVRFNSASALEQLGFTYDDLIGSAAGNDRYAREMLTYRLEMRGLNELAERRRKEAATV